MSTAKPEFVVFYAWQSDRKSSHNRYFIQEALAQAAAQLNNEPSFSYSIRIDQDTLDIPGLCDIPATILRKIDQADAFVCDLTYIAVTQAEEVEEEHQPRFCSNPNVLFELGYAFRAISPERILCVMNEYYGPVANQIFDLAHRRFPLAYTLPNDDLTRSQVIDSLTGKMVSALQSITALGCRNESGSADRVLQIRSDFDERVRSNRFHGLVRRAGAMALTLIPSPGFSVSHEVLNNQTLPPLGASGWNRSNRGESIISVRKIANTICSVAEMRTDGVIFCADTFILDSTFHSSQEGLLYPAQSAERAIIFSTKEYLELLRTLSAPLPWALCISLLEVRNYWLVSGHEHSRDAFPDIDITANPIVIDRIDGPFDQRRVATLLRPAFDYIWREFGLTDCFHYTAGVYNLRLI